MSAGKKAIATEEAAAEAYRQFAEEVAEAELKLAEHETPKGRVPAVRCFKGTAVADVMRATRGKVTVERDGPGFVVYPVV